MIIELLPTTAFVLRHPPLSILTRSLVAGFHGSHLLPTITEFESDPEYDLEALTEELRDPTVAGLHELCSVLRRHPSSAQDSREPQPTSPTLSRLVEALFECLHALSCDEESCGKVNVLLLERECVRTIQAVMDSTMELDYIVENKEYTAKLAQGECTARRCSCWEDGLVLG